MALGTLNPVAVQQFSDNNGAPLAGGTLSFYQAGTETPSPVYNDPALTIPLVNPLVLDAGGRAPVHYLDALSYKQVLKNAAGVTIWTADNIISPLALRGVSQTVALSGTNNNFQVSAGIITVLTLTHTGHAVITGFAGGQNGQLLFIRQGYNGTTDLMSVSSSSASGNQMINHVQSGPTTIVGDAGAAIYAYQYPYWLLISHEQGRPITVPYAAGNFLAVPSGTWTVEAADQKTYTYYLKGTMLTVTFTIQQTTVGGGPTALQLGGLPYAFAAAVAALPTLISTASAPYAPGYAIINAGQRSVNLGRSDGAAFPDMTDTLHMLGQFQGAVT